MSNNTIDANGGNDIVCVADHGSVVHGGTGNALLSTDGVNDTVSTDCGSGRDRYSFLDVDSFTACESEGLLV